METPSNPQDVESPPPNAAASASAAASSSSSSNSNGVLPSIPPSPRSIPRSDGSPYPTTFVQADTSSFKHVVQMLTGSAETAAKQSAAPPKIPAFPASRAPGPKKPAFKLYERRGSLKHLKPLPAGFSSLRNPPEIVSPSTLDFPSLVLSPVTPLILDPFNRSSAASEEDRAIAQKGFYLHPSPRDAGGAPRLLPLFPLTSPRISPSSSSPAAASSV